LVREDHVLQRAYALGPESGKTHGIAQFKPARPVQESQFERL
jgi:hypothetical protein